MTAMRHASTPGELRERLLAERAGWPFILFRAAREEQIIVALSDDQTQMTIGRDERCELQIPHDPEVSRVHAELHRLGAEWVMVDDGLSRNGSFVNGERIAGQVRLHDGDAIRCGGTVLTFHDPLYPRHESTRAEQHRIRTSLSPTQRNVLVALCRPLRTGDPYALPASNQAIADELHLSVGAIKAHLRALFEKLQIENLPHNQKRVRLVERALESGLIAPRELR